MNKSKNKFYVIILTILIILVSIFIINNYKINKKEEKIILNNDLPKLYITGDVLKLENKKDKLKVKINYKSKDLKFETYATIKIQGQSSVNSPKKNYNIVFYEDENLDKKQKVDFKWGEFDKYTLKAEWVDTTYSKNIVNSRIASDINKNYGYFKNTPHNGTIDGFPIEIYINNEYHGLYNLNLNKENMFYEQVEKDYTLISSQSSSSMKKVKEETLDWNYFEVEVGEENQETLNSFNRLLVFLNTSTDEEFKRNVEEYLDLDSLLNYYCFVRYAELWDNLGKNLYFLTYDGKIWYTIFYDLDLSHDLEYSFRYVDKITAEYPLWSKLEKNYKKELSQRYTELRKDILTKENVLNKFKEYRNSIPESAIKNDFQYWDRKGKTIEDIEYYLDNHISKVDKYFEELGK